MYDSFLVLFSPSSRYQFTGLLFLSEFPFFRLLSLDFFRVFFVFVLVTLSSLPLSYLHFTLLLLLLFHLIIATVQQPPPSSFCATAAAAAMPTSLALSILDPPSVFV